MEYKIIRLSDRDRELVESLAKTRQAIFESGGCIRASYFDKQGIRVIADFDLQEISSQGFNSFIPCHKVEMRECGYFIDSLLENYQQLLEEYDPAMSCFSDAFYNTYARRVWDALNNRSAVFNAMRNVDWVTPRGWNSH